jgi:hypothetical protein
LGNTIQNSQNIAINGQFNFVNLYNKIEVAQEDQRQGQGAGRVQGRQGTDTPTKADSTKTAKPTR